MHRALPSVMWPWIVRGWVLGPMLVWGLSARPAIQQSTIWLIASLIVCAMGCVQPVRRAVRWVGLGLLVLLVMLPIHWADPMLGDWIVTTAILLLAIHFIAERGEWAWIRQAILAGATVQLILVGVFLLDMDVIKNVLPWTSVGSGIAGTLGKRGACAAVLAVASLLTTSWRSWVFACASLATTSLIGLVPIAYLLWKHTPWMVIAPLAVSSPWWIDRLLNRVSGWQYFPPLTLTGYGFGLLPSGFQADGGGGMWPTKLFRDYHSTILDWVARTGWVGLTIAALACFWIGYQTANTKSWGWLLVMGAILACHSLEELPVLGVLAACWIVYLGGKHAVHPI